MNNHNHEMPGQGGPSDASLERPLKIIDIGYMIVGLLMVFLVTFGLLRLQLINQQLKDIVKDNNVKTELAYKMQFIARERIVLLQAVVNTEDVFEREERIQDFYALAPRFMALFNEQLKQKLSDAEKALITAQRQNMLLATPLQEKVLQLVQDGDIAQARTVLMKKTIPAQDKTLDVMGRFINFQFEQTHVAAKRAEKNYQRAVLYMGISGAIALVLSIVIALFVNRRMGSLLARLKTREQEARVLLDNIPELVWLKNCESRYVWANHQFEQATGLASAQLAGLSDKEVWQGGSAGCQGDDRRAMATGTTIQNEKTLTNLAGVSRQYATSRAPIFDREGNCVGVLGVAHDMTERERLHEEIREAGQELKFQKAALDQHAIVSIADINGNITYVNDKFCEISRYAQDELMGQNHRLLKSGYHPPAFFNEMWMAISRGRVWEGEVCNRAKDGSLYWVKTTIVPFLDEQGVPLRYVSIRTDITHVKEAQKLLQRSQEELEELVQERTSELVVAKYTLEMDIEARRQAEEALSQFKVTLDKTHDSVFMFAPGTLKFIYANRGAASQVGYSIEELLQMTPLDIKSDITRERFDALLEGLLSGRQGSITFETIHVHKDGHRIPVEVLLQYIHPDGAEARFVAIVRDITERKRTESELRKRYEEVKELNDKLQEAQSQLLQSEKMASIGQLAAGVAHEINNPIGYVYSNLGTLEKYVQDVFSMVETYEQAEAVISDGEVRTRLQSAKDALDMEFLKADLPALMNESKEGITRVKKIVQDLKDFSHIEVAEEWHYANLHAGLDSTLNIVNNEIKYKVEVVKEYGAIPEVECLSSQLNQVFMNLLVNAAHAIEEHGTITIRTGSLNDEVWVEIADTGKGIAPENLQRIFDPFFTTKPIGKGTGLGLSLSYGIIQKHHGRIEVQSEVGKGTAFRVWLPVKRVANS